ncbi:unnamed protein product, partial [Pylaiella littoralis]
VQSADESVTGGTFSLRSSARKLEESSSEDEVCSNGYAGIENGRSCCLLACGQCGGIGCSSIDDLTGNDCCPSNIQQNGDRCSQTDSAPCWQDVYPDDGES